MESRRFIGGEPKGGAKDPPCKQESNTMYQAIFPRLLVTTAFLMSCGWMPIALAFEPLKYNHPGLTVDLGVGLWAWPMPMDWDQDGDLDLIVSSPDTPYNGTYFFENTDRD